MRLVTLLAVAALSFWGGDKAWAQSCGTSATGVAFGNYAPLSGLAATSAATVTVTCNPGLISLLVSYTVQIGTGGSGNFSARSMSGTGTPLRYQIYQDALFTTVWGDGTGGTSSLTDGYLLGVILPVVRPYTAYGRILGSQVVAIGAYSDLVTVIIVY